MNPENSDPGIRLEPGDFYIDGEYMVFTAAYHLKRGSCCGSGCRHCPYGLAPSETDRAYREAPDGATDPEAAG